MPAASRVHSWRSWPDYVCNREYQMLALQGSPRWSLAEAERRGLAANDSPLDEYGTWVPQFCHSAHRS
eukprot:129749-Pyramimonas_sp.AAC.1